LEEREPTACAHAEFTRLLKPVVNRVCYTFDCSHRLSRGDNLTTIRSFAPKREINVWAYVLSSISFYTELRCRWTTCRLLNFQVPQNLLSLSRLIVYYYKVFGEGKHIRMS